MRTRPPAPITTRSIRSSAIFYMNIHTRYVREKKKQFFTERISRRPEQERETDMENEKLDTWETSINSNFKYLYSSRKEKGRKGSLSAEERHKGKCEQWDYVNVWSVAICRIDIKSSSGELREMGKRVKKVDFSSRDAFSGQKSVRRCNKMMKMWNIIEWEFPQQYKRFLRGPGKFNRR